MLTEEPTWKDKNPISYSQSDEIVTKSTWEQISGSPEERVSRYNTLVSEEAAEQIVMTAEIETIPLLDTFEKTNIIKNFAIKNSIYLFPPYDICHYFSIHYRV